MRHLIALVLLGLPPQVPDARQSTPASQKPSPLCGCQEIPPWVNAKPGLDEMGNSIHYARYVVRDLEGYEDFACNVKSVERVSETLNRASYYRFGSGAEKILVAGSISARALKDPEELWDEHVVRERATDACSNGGTESMWRYLEEGACLSKLNAAARRDDKDAHKAATAELFKLLERQNERMQAEITRIQIGAEQRQGDPPK